ncbi:MAG: hypothetical protein QXY45_03385 [Candidatus Aenigmatarchaeota archaeon]
MKKLLSVIIIILLIQPVLSITWPSRSMIQDIKNAIAGNPVWPYDSLKNIFFYVFIPFWGAFLIVYGLLSRINIFKSKRINLLLSLLFAMSLLYYGAILWIVSLIYSLGAFFSVIAFGVVFIICVFLFAKSKKGEWEQKALSMEGLSKDIQHAMKQLKETEEELRIVREDLTDARSPTRIRQLKAREKQLLATIGNLRKQIMGLKTKNESLISDIVTGYEDDDK